jgi:hypothetical protein
MIQFTVTYGRDSSGGYNLTLSVTDGVTVIASPTVTYTTDFIKLISFGVYGYPRVELITAQSGSVPALQRVLLLDYTGFLPIRSTGTSSLSYSITYNNSPSTPIYNGSVPILYENSGSAATSLLSKIRLSVSATMVVPPPNNALMTTYLFSRKLSDDNSSYDRSAYFMGASICFDNNPINAVITSSDTNRDEIPRTSTSDSKLLSVYSDNDVDGNLLLVPRYTEVSDSHVFVGTDTGYNQPHTTAFLSSAFAACETSATTMQLSITSGTPISIPGGGVKFPGYYANVSPNSYTRRVMAYGVDGSSGSW